MCLCKVQLEVEREREREFEDLYRDEAQRMFARQQAEWDREKAAREKLMAQVDLGKLSTLLHACLRVPQHTHTHTHTILPGSHWS